MRGRLLLILVAALGGCGLTDAADAPLGRCADSTARWWPLDEGNRWLYLVRPLDGEAGDDVKELVIQRAPARVGGLAGDQEGVRAWRNDPEGTGWRWFVDEGSALSFRRDVWLGGLDIPAPCPALGPDEDVRGCTEVAPTEETYFLPRKTRLDYGRDRVCERSAWQDRYDEWTIEIGQPDGLHPDRCPLDVWRQGQDGAGCAVSDKKTSTEEWTVASVGRRIEVPAGAFEDTLCVVRADSTDPQDPREVTYCFARGIGKVYEIDDGNRVECLTEYCVDGGPCEPVGGPSYGCDEDELD